MKSPQAFMRRPLRLSWLRLGVATLLCSWLGPVSAQAEVARTPRQLIGVLDAEIRKRFDTLPNDGNPLDAELATAQQIDALVRSAPTDTALTEQD